MFYAKRVVFKCVLLWFYEMSASFYHHDRDHMRQMVLDINDPIASAIGWKGTGWVRPVQSAVIDTKYRPDLLLIKNSDAPILSPFIAGGLLTFVCFFMRLPRYAFADSLIPLFVETTSMFFCIVCIGLIWGTHKQVLDRRDQALKSNVWARMDEHLPEKIRIKGKKRTSLENIHAVQLIRRRGLGFLDDGLCNWWCYEINLVFTDHTRVFLMVERSRSKSYTHAEVIADFLGVPLWNTSQYPRTSKLFAWLDVN